jgi:hypothetical protein
MPEKMRTYLNALIIGNVVVFIESKRTRDRQTDRQTDRRRKCNEQMKTYTDIRMSHDANV